MSLSVRSPRLTKFSPCMTFHPRRYILGSIRHSINEGKIIQFYAAWEADFWKRGPVSDIVCQKLN